VPDAGEFDDDHDDEDVHGRDGDAVKAAFNDSDAKI